jgi:predicted outer membrane repeat protein
VLSRVVFYANTAKNRGGAIYNNNGASPTVTNALFLANQAEDGGAVRNQDNSSPAFHNTVFYGNSASGSGSAIFSEWYCQPSVTNSIFWANAGGDFTNTWSSDLTITWSDVEGGYSGTGNINADPRFVNAAGGDFSLLPDSPCIDAANGDTAPATDIRYRPRVDVGTVLNTGTGAIPYVDIGAYEYQP